jgi:hypothetical protein
MGQHEPEPWQVDAVAADFARERAAARKDALEEAAKTVDDAKSARWTAAEEYEARGEDDEAEALEEQATALNGVAVAIRALKDRT